MNSLWNGCSSSIVSARVLGTSALSIIFFRDFSYFYIWLPTWLCTFLDTAINHQYQYDGDEQNKCTEGNHWNDRLFSDAFCVAISPSDLTIISVVYVYSYFSGWALIGVIPGITRVTWISLIRNSSISTCLLIAFWLFNVNDWVNWILIFRIFLWSWILSLNALLAKCVKGNKTNFVYFSSTIVSEYTN